MLKLEQLDNYVTTTASKLYDDDDGNGNGVCTHCGVAEATISVCKSCLPDVVTEMKILIPNVITQDISGVSGELHVFRVPSG